MALKKKAKHETTVLEALKAAILEAEKNDIHSFVFIGLNDGGGFIKKFLNSKEFGVQAVAYLEITKHEILNQIPMFRNDEM
jgi:type III secretory pathway component EscV